MLDSKLVLLVFFSLKCSTTHVFLFTFTFHLFIVCLLLIFALCSSSFTLFTLICFLITFKFLFAASYFVFFFFLLCTIVFPFSTTLLGHLFFFSSYVRDFLLLLHYIDQIVLSQLQPKTVCFQKIFTCSDQKKLLFFLR